jgi:hypothetical protein
MKEREEKERERKKERERERSTTEKRETEERERERKERLETLKISFCFRRRERLEYFDKMYSISMPQLFSSLFAVFCKYF